MERHRIAALTLCVAVATGAARAAGDATRPILHFKTDGEEIQLAAVYPDGREMPLKLAGMSAAWAPGGDRFAYAASAENLSVGTLDGETKAILARKVSWPAWSPDGTKIAFVAEQSIVIVDVATSKVILRHQLHRTVGSPYATQPLYRFRWSPDGSKILLAFHNAVVLDVNSNKLQVISKKPAATEWAPKSDAVYAVDFQEDGPGMRSIRSVFLRRLSSKDTQLLMPRAAVASSRLVSQEFMPVLLRLSPDGARLAMVTGLREEMVKAPTTVVRIYDVSGGIPDLTRPLSEFRAQRLIAALDWAPDGKALAATTIQRELAAENQEGYTVQVEVLDLADGSWKKLASESLTAEQIGALAWFRTLSWTQ